MMTNEQYLLGKLAEEAAELAQIAIKAQQFGLNEVFGGQETPLSNRQRIADEYTDVVALVHMLNTEESANIFDNAEGIAKKVSKVTRWRDYARTLGMVE